MTENMKAFVEQVEKDGLLKAELEAIAKEYGEKKERELDIKEVLTQKTIAVAAKHGFTLTAEDFKQESGELTLDQLDAVTGGGACACWILGVGDNFDGGGCGCLAAGYGGGDDGGGSAIMRCGCALFGMGGDKPLFE